MIIDFASAPFREIRMDLREWFSRTVARAVTETDFDILRAAPPTGSSSDDAVAVSAAIREIFPARSERARAMKTLSLMAMPPFEI
jgi:hypothetical protein